MKAIKLYKKIEKEFAKKSIKEDNWFEKMIEVAEFLCKSFEVRNTGLVCDFASEINKVYTAVFPTDKVLRKIINDNATDAMLFVHHPCIWDIENNKNAWSQMNPILLREFRKRKISIYCLHLPLDNYGKYSTSKTLADALGIKISKPFGQYNGATCGILGTSPVATASELDTLFAKTLGHDTSLYNYGDNALSQKIAVVAGGGNDVKFLEQLVENNVNTLITGIAILNNHSQKAHEFAQKNKINLLGGSHYSTEKFACIKMCEFFDKFKLKAEFLDDKPSMGDI